MSDEPNSPCSCSPRGTPVGGRAPFPPQLEAAATGAVTSSPGAAVTASGSAEGSHEVVVGGMEESQKGRGEGEGGEGQPLLEGRGCGEGREGGREGGSEGVEGESSGSVQPLQQTLVSRCLCDAATAMADRWSGGSIGSNGSIGGGYGFGSGSGNSSEGLPSPLRNIEWREDRPAIVVSSSSW